jgi:hypothetical protein
MWGSAPLIQAKTGEARVTVWIDMESVPIVREEDRFGDNPFYFSPHRRLCLSFSLKACDTSAPYYAPLMLHVEPPQPWYDLRHP